MNSTVGKLAVAAGALLLAVVMLLGAAATGAVAIITGPVTTIGYLLFGLHTTGGVKALAAATSIPERYLSLYIHAATTCPGLPWTILAGIGRVETNHGQDPNEISQAGAVGPMQFLPTTFDAYAEPVPPGGLNPPTPWDPTDAIYAASRYLCASGARNGTNLQEAIFTYNHSTDYVANVITYANRYAAEATTLTQNLTTTTTALPDGITLPAGTPIAVATAIRYALAQLGKPYLWGGVGPNGYDCSGLVMTAYHTAGITIPRITYQQATTGTAVGSIPELEPGDLIFIPGGDGTAQHPGHVGMYLGTGLIVEAPQTGDVVKIINISAWESQISAMRRIVE